MSKNGWMCAAAALGVIPLTLGACAVASDAQMGTKERTNSDT